MSDEEQYRPSGWLPPDPVDRSEPARASSGPRVPYPLAVNLSADAPDPWDRLRPAATATDDEAPAEPEPSGVDSSLPVGGRHIRPGRTGIRILLTALAVTILLIGSGALARNLTSRSVALPAPTPPPVPAPTTTATSSPGPGVAAQLGAAPRQPSPSVTATTTATATPTVATPDPAPTVTSVLREYEYEAEQADLRGNADSYQVETASGGYAVRGLGSGWFSSGEVRFTVEVEQAGEYELTLYYLADRSRSGRIRVNGGDPVELEFPGLSGGDEVGAVSLTVTLGEGGNEIRFGGTSRHAPALDRITLTHP